MIAICFDMFGLSYKSRLYSLIPNLVFVTYVPSDGTLSFQYRIKKKMKSETKG